MVILENDDIWILSADRGRERPSGSKGIYEDVGEKAMGDAYQQMQIPASYRYGDWLERENRGLVQLMHTHFEAPKYVNNALLLNYRCMPLTQCSLVKDSLNRCH